MEQGVGVGSVMWIAHTKGWLSIVAHRDYPDMLLVRSRRPSHISSLFHDAEIYEDAWADYPYRADISRSEVANVLIDQASNIQYDNFKNHVNEKELSHALAKVWQRIWEYGLEYRPPQMLEGGI